MNYLNYREFVNVELDTWGLMVFLSFSQYLALFIVTTEVQSHISSFGMLTINMD